MANIELDIDNTESTQFELIPPGEYKAIMTESEVKQTNAGTGTYLKATWLIVDGEHEGRKIWEMYTLTNPNAKATVIGRGQLKSIALAMGKTSGMVNDSEEMHDKPVLIKVKTEPGQGEYGPKNRISGYMPIPKRETTTLENDNIPWTQA
jgi:hypothetical protein